MHFAPLGEETRMAAVTDLMLSRFMSLRHRAVRQGRCITMLLNILQSHEPSPDSKIRGPGASRCSPEEEAPPVVEQSWATGEPSSSAQDNKPVPWPDPRPNTWGADWEWDPHPGWWARPGTEPTTARKMRNKCKKTRRGGYRAREVRDQRRRRESDQAAASAAAAESSAEAAGSTVAAESSTSEAPSEVDP